MKAAIIILIIFLTGCTCLSSKETGEALGTGILDGILWSL